MHVAVPNEVRQPEQSGGSFRHTARCPKARPPGLGGHQSMKCNNGFVGLEEERLLARIAWFQLWEAVMMKE